MMIVIDDYVPAEYRCHDCCALLRKQDFSAGRCALCQQVERARERAAKEAKP